MNAAESHTPGLDAFGVLGFSIDPIEVGTENPNAYNRIDHGVHLSAKLKKTLFNAYFIFLESAYFHGVRDFDPQNISKNRNLNLNVGIGYALQSQNE